MVKFHIAGDQKVMSVLQSLLVCLFLIVSFVSHANAMINPLSSCVASDNLGGNNAQTIYVAPNDVGCQNLCQEECSRYLGGIAGSQQMNMALFKDDINSDIITECLVQCQNGQFYAPQYIRAYNSDGTIRIVSNNTPIARQCTNIVNYPVSQTGISLMSGDSFTVSLGGDQENKLYLCGQRSVILEPLISNDYNTNNTAWINTQKNIVKESSLCLANMSPGDWNLRNSNKSIWYRIQATDTCNWHARNYLFTDTGIWVRDDDELSITYSGQYGIGINALPQNIINDSNASVSYNNLSAPYSTSITPYTYNFQNIKFAYGFLSSLEVLKAEQNPRDSKAPYYVMSGEKIRAGALTDYVINTITDPNTVGGTPNPSWFWFGLAPSIVETKNPNNTSSYTDGRTVTINLPNNRTCAVVCGATPTSSNCNANGDASLSTFISNACKYITAPSNPTYTYSGILSGFSSTPAKLAFRHREFDSSTPINYYDNVVGITTDPGCCYSRRYQDNLGGMQVKVNWGGCVNSNGQRLQYAIAPQVNAPNQPSIPESQWCNVFQGSGPGDCQSTCEIGQSACNLTASSQGQLYLRIAPIQAASSGFDVYPYEAANTPDKIKIRLRDYYTSPNLFGSYKVIAQNNFANGAINFSGPIINLVGFVRSTLLGNNGSGGVLKNLYTNLVSQSSFVSVIRAFLVMYLSYVAIGFLIGVIELNQKEVVTRILKVTFVSIMISEASWQFFYNTLFVFIIDGGGALMLQVVQPLVSAAQLGSLRFTSDPISVFAIFDGPLSQLLSQQVWIKIYAIFCTSLLGIPLVILIIDGVLTYLVVLAKSALAYIASIIGIAFLLFLTPVFVPMILFKFTQDIFTKWWKALLSNMLNPVILFTCIAFFNILIVQCIYALFGFTACPSCFLGIDLIIDSICLIPTYKIMSSLFTDSSVSFFSLPVNLVSGIMIFCIITHAMNSIIEFSTMLAGMIMQGYGGEASLMQGVNPAMQTMYRVTTGASSWAVDKVHNRIDEARADAQNPEGAAARRGGAAGIGGAGGGRGGARAARRGGGGNGV